MAVSFSPAAQEQFETIVARYPVRRAAIMPTLWLAQKEFGYISPETMEYIAKLLDLSPAFVASSPPSIRCTTKSRWGSSTFRSAPTFHAL